MNEIVDKIVTMIQSPSVTNETELLKTIGPDCITSSDVNSHVRVMNTVEVKSGLVKKAIELLTLWDHIRDQTNYNLDDNGTSTVFASLLTLFTITPSLADQQEAGFIIIIPRTCFRQRHAKKATGQTYRNSKQKTASSLAFRGDGFRSSVKHVSVAVPWEAFDLASRGLLTDGLLARRVTL